MLLRTLHIMRRTRRQITVMSLVREAGLDPTLVHRRTFSKYLNALGFKFLQVRKKGGCQMKTRKKVLICQRHEEDFAQMPRFLC